MKLCAETLLKRFDMRFLFTEHGLLSFVVVLNTMFIFLPKLAYEMPVEVLGDDGAQEAEGHQC